MTNSDKQIIIITGPTAVGKTKLSIEVAKFFRTEIISADSRQFYKELKIGTAPPSDSELKEVKHHFIGHLSIYDYYNVSKYENDAIKKIDSLFKDHDRLIMTGGSGLYIDAVVKGIDDLPDADTDTREYLKAKFEAEGITSLQVMLKNLDPEFCKQVDMNNPARLIRAVEVCMTTGLKYSDLRKSKNKKRNFNCLFIGLNREKNELIEIIKKRTNIMIQQGLVEEATELYPFRNLNALNTVGYTELFEYIEGKTTLEQAIENININTRKYAKRQLTWFRKNKAMQWFHPNDKEKIMNYILNNQR
ncbi:MAG TPA: tRNA (adenosine(37)-N6)-dimethylallyltransferase MiaA [Bacteroidales bacterium]|nr:tRNA (adenosine(37)-N6)-dimethylallyltransferase MiaA [Bacteroidales bacterium]HPS17906.1 tRNA (adenosine(37)-N6)-dimethylallyltransferase MiaA [Bacteroidales bacterium]